jgi:PIN domain nuclease of toxin-antitoxin system
MSDLWLLDTHIWIRLLNGYPLFNTPGFLSALQEQEKTGRIRIASISLWETAMLVAKGRLSLSMPVLDWLTKAQTMPGLSVLPLTAEIAADSCFLPPSFHGDPVDRLIVATARTVNATLLTFDQAILSYGTEGWVKAINPLTSQSVGPN